MNATTGVWKQSQASFWEFLNPRIYLVSLLPGLAFLNLAPYFFPGGPVPWVPVAWATLALIVLQHGVNLLNDLEDDRRGADLNKTDSWIHYYRDSQKLRRVAFCYFAMGIILGLSCLIHYQAWTTVAWALPFVTAAWAYNRRDFPISYSRWAEWVTAACYGPGVIVSLAMLTNSPLQFRHLSLSLAFAALATAVLLAHQIPQIEDDRRVDKMSFALRNGPAKTREAVRGLIFIFILTSFIPIMGEAVGLISAGALIYWATRRQNWNPGQILEFALGILIVEKFLIYFLQKN